MMVRRSWTWLTAGLALVLLALPSTAQNAGGIGIVDLDRVFKEYDHYVQLDKNLQELQTRLQSEVQMRQFQYPLLLDEEFNRLMELMRKQNPTAEDQQNLQKLRSLSNERDAELARLEGLADNAITPEQSNQRKYLLNLRSQCQEAMVAMEKQYAERFETEMRKTAEEIEANFATAGKQVAEEKGLSAILRKNAVIYAAIDVTTEMIAKLNAIKPPAN